MLIGAIVAMAGFVIVVLGINRQRSVPFVMGSVIIVIGVVTAFIGDNRDRHEMIDRALISQMFVVEKIDTFNYEADVKTTAGCMTRVYIVVDERDEVLILQNGHTVTGLTAKCGTRNP